MKIQPLTFHSRAWIRAKPSDVELGFNGARRLGRYPDTTKTTPKTQSKMPLAFPHPGLTLWLSGPKSSGARPLPDGRKQEPGEWNRIVLEVDDLPSRVEALKKVGLRFRNEIEKLTAAAQR
jgi:hypothetical protein